MRDHFPTVHNFPGESSSYPVAPSTTVIPAQAGIHRGEHSAPPTTIDLPDYVSGHAAEKHDRQTPTVTTAVARARTRELLYRFWTPSPDHERPQAPLLSALPPWRSCSYPPTAPPSSASSFPWPWPSLHRSLSRPTSLLRIHGYYRKTSRKPPSA